MRGSQRPLEEEQWIIWNSALGIRDFVMIDRVEVGPDGRRGWLEEPYDMVGPFDFDALTENGCIDFAECTVMSRQRWQEDQAALREASFERRRKAQEKFYEDLERSNRRKRLRRGTPMVNEEEERALLELPLEGALEVSQVKAAYRRLAKKAHPDVGGSHEHFVRITNARDALLEIIL